MRNLLFPDKLMCFSLMFIPVNRILIIKPYSRNELSSFLILVELDFRCSFYIEVRKSYLGLKNGSNVQIPVKFLQFSNRGIGIRNSNFHRFHHPGYMAHPNIVISPAGMFLITLFCNMNGCAI